MLIYKSLSKNSKGNTRFIDDLWEIFEVLPYFRLIELLLFCSVKLLIFVPMPKFLKNAEHPWKQFYRYPPGFFLMEFYSFCLELLLGSENFLFLQIQTDVA